MSASSSFERLRGTWSRRRWLAVLTFLGVAAAAVTLALCLPGVYRATATVLVEPGQNDSVRAANFEAQLRTISHEILSRARLEQLIRQYGLYPGAKATGSLEGAVQQMRKDIKMDLKEVQDASSGRGTTVAFDLSYRSADPSLAAQVTNSLAAFFVAEDRSLQRRQASGTVQSLKAQLDDMKPKLDAQEKRMGQFQESHLGELPEQSMANLATLDRLNAQLRLTTDDRLRAIQKKDDLQKRLNEAEPPSASDPEMLGARIAKLNQELMDLRRRFSDRYPDVVRLQQEIAALEKQASQSRGVRAPATPAGRYTQRLRDQYNDADAEIRNLKAQEDRIKSEILAYHQRLEAAPRRQQAMQEISRDYRSTKELYDTLLRKYEEAQLAEGSVQEVPRPRFRILDPAVPPSVAVEPNRLRIAIMGVMLALLLAAGLVVAAEHLDDQLHSVAEVRGFTRVPVLVSIPTIVTESDLRGRRRRLLAGAALALLGITVIIHATRYVAARNDGLVMALARGRS